KKSAAGLIALISWTALTALSTKRVLSDFGYRWVSAMTANLNSSAPKARSIVLKTGSQPALAAPAAAPVRTDWWRKVRRVIPDDGKGWKPSDPRYGSR